MSEPEIQLSSAEKRLLRKTFRRHAAPYLVVAVATALWALSWGRVETEAPPGDSLADTVVVADPAFQRLARQVERSEATLRELSKSAANSPTAGPAPEAPIYEQLAALEQRAGQVERRLRELERPLGPDGASSSEVAGILERLQRMELRQDSIERNSTDRDADGAATQRGILDRLQNLESRISGVEGR